MRTLLALLTAAALTLGLAGCAGTNDAIDDAQSRASDAAEDIEGIQDLEWAQYPNGLRDRVEDYAAEDNCQGLNAELDKLDAGRDGELIAFLQRQIEQAGCA